MPLPVFAARSGVEAFEAVNDAIAARRRLEIVGAGTRRGFGRPVEADATLDLAGLSGVVDYQPEELVLTVLPGTPLAELEALLGERGQMLAFEPPDLGPLWGGAAGAGSIGGAVMTGRGGPRRLTAGAPRDHCLGVKGINGFGDAFAAGGRVVKNVTGFDLPKLAAGSFGTLCVVTELTLKVLPAPPGAATLVLLGLEDGEAVRAMAQALGSPVAVTAAAHLPAAAAAGSAVPIVAGAGAGVTLLRLEGVRPSLDAGLDHLRRLLGPIAASTVLNGPESLAVWKEIAGAAYFTGPGERVVWKLSVAPAVAAGLAQRLVADLGGRAFYDWGGGGVWLELPASEDGGQAVVRARLAEAAGEDGHAVLMRAPEAIRAAGSPFQPQPPGLAALTARVKAQFDPLGLFNPRRMYGA